LVKRPLLVGLAVAFALISSDLHAQTEDGAGSILSTFQDTPGAFTHLKWENVRSASKLSVSDESGSKQVQRLTFFRSLLIPGWGQLTAGKRWKAYAFFGVETALIASLISFKTSQGWLEDDYKTFARQHAGIDGGRDHQFYVDIGNWQNEVEFNEQRLRDRQFDLVYTDATDRWNWDSEENRTKFKSMRVSADKDEQKAMLVVGALVLNHLLSAIDASVVAGERKKLSVSPSSMGGFMVVLNFW